MPGPKRELAVEDVRSLLAELGRRLSARGVEATIYIVGGAAMALQFDTRRVTVDIDAIFHPEATVAEEARSMATEHDLPDDWLNNSARAFAPGDDVAAVKLAVPGLAVAIASPAHLLAMKMAAFRPTDIADLRLLFDELLVQTAEEAADIALEVYGPDTVIVPGRDELILQARAVLERRRPRPQ